MLTHGYIIYINKVTHIKVETPKEKPLPAIKNDDLIILMGFSLFLIQP